VTLKHHFYRASSYARAVLTVVILSVRPSVCPSVCLPDHMRDLWPNQTMHCEYFDTTRKGNYFSFPAPTMISRQRPLSSEICAQIYPPPSKNADFNRFPLITSQP